MKIVGSKREGSWEADFGVQGMWRRRMIGIMKSRRGMSGPGEWALRLLYLFLGGGRRGEDFVQWIGDLFVC